MKHSKTIAQWCKQQCYSGLSVLLIILFSALGNKSFAQLVNSLPINTGYNNSIGGVIGLNTQDPNWEITGLTTPLIPWGTLNYDAFTSPSWTTTLTNSRWITYGPNRMTVAGAQVDNTPGTITYRRQFTTCIDDDYVISGNIKYDNTLTSFKVDGTNVPFTPGTTAPFSLSTFLAAGTHAIEITVSNIAQAVNTNPIGIDIVGTVASGTSTASIVDRDKFPDYACAGTGCDLECYWRVTGNTINAGNNIFGTLSNDDVAIHTNAQPRGIFTANGLMGWNTTGPNAFFHVDCIGNNPDDGSAGSDIRFENLEPGTGSILVIGDDGFVYNSGQLIGPSGGLINNCGTPDMVTKTDASGNLTCSQIFDDGTSVGIATTTGYAGSFNYTTMGMGVTSGPTPIAPSGIVRLDVNGVARADAYLATSDARLKTDIKEIADPMKLIEQLSGKKYKWTEEARRSSNLDGGEQYGFIAQELAKVIPEAVAKDSKGNYAVNYNMIIPVLAEAQKQLQQENIKLADEVAELKQQVKQLQQGAGTADVNKKYSYLEQNIPNPFNAETVISYYVNDMRSNAYIAVYTLSGEQLQKQEITAKGKGQVTVHSNNLSAGMYLYSLIIDGVEADTKKMILSK